MAKPGQTYRMDQGCHDWIRSEADKLEDRGAGWFLNDLITKHMNATNRVATPKKELAVKKEALDFSSWPYTPDRQLLDD